MIPLFALLLAASMDPKPAADYLVVDAQTRQVVQNHWPDADTPIPVGSLVKPFTALAYGGEFPEFVCRGAEDRCWLRQGHGRVTFRDALAQSCNAYFLNLARRVDPATLAVIASKFGISAPAVDTPEARIGLGKDWKISPVALARAYAELASRSVEPRVAEILAGMRAAARAGTASALSRQTALAKTGTAPCIAARGHAGDGFTVVLDPANAPRIVLLVRVHGVPGSEAARTAGAVLRTLHATR